MRQGLCSQSMLCTAGASNSANVRRFLGNVRILRATPTARAVRATSTRVEFSARVEVVEVQERIEHERIAADRLAAIHWIVAEQHYVALAHRRVHHHRPPRYIVPVQKSRRKQLALITESQDDTWPQCWRDHRERI